jgi:hypothetical protein
MEKERKAWLARGIGFIERWSIEGRRSLLVMT